MVHFEIRYSLFDIRYSTRYPRPPHRRHIPPLFDSGEADGDGRRVATWVARVIVDRPGRERGAVALTITFSVSERVHELSGLCQNILTPVRSRDRLASLGL